MAEGKKKIFTKNWTGEEVGRAVIEHLIDEYRTVFDRSHRSAMDVGQLEQLKAALIMDSDRRAYNQYITLYNGILDLVSQSQSMTQQFYHGYYRLMNVVQETVLAAAAAEEIRSFPRVMTRQQYLQESKRQKEQRGSRRASAADMTLTAAAYYAGFFSSQRRPPSPQPVRDEAEALQKELFTNTEVFAQIARIAGCGFFCREGAQAPSAEDLRRQEYRMLCGGAEPEEVRQWRARQLGWVEDRAIPAGTTKWDVLYGRFRDAAFRYFLSGEPKEKFPLFLHEFPAFARALRRQLQLFPEIAPAFDPGEDLFEPSASWKELALLHVPGFRDRLDPSSDALMEGKEPETQPVAILVEQRNPSRNAAAGRDFTSPADTVGRMFQTLSGHVDPDAAAFRETLIVPAMRSLYACSSMIAIIGEAYRFEDIGVLAPQMESFEEKVSLLNDIILALYSRVKGQEDLRRRMTRYLHLIDTEQLRPREAALSEARRELADLPSLNKAAFASLLRKLQATDGGGC